MVNGKGRGEAPLWLACWRRAGADVNQEAHARTHRTAPALTQSQTLVPPWTVAAGRWRAGRFSRGPTLSLFLRADDDAAGTLRGLLALDLGVRAFTAFARLLARLGCTRVARAQIAPFRASFLLPR